jgi:DNA-binding PadR family transcriptional regulator
VTAETASDRNRRLYGRPRVPRGHRRVMLALLAADGLSGYPLSRLAQAALVTVYNVLDKLEDLGWAGREQDAESGRAFYTLNSEGRAGVRLLLGLPAETARPAPEET